MPDHSLEALFHDQASPYDYYVGLVHFATQPGTHQLLGLANQIEKAGLYQAATDSLKPLEEWSAKQHSS